MHHAVIDRLSMQSTFLHRLGARTKLVSALAFTILTISMPQSTPSILACCAAGPFAMLIAARVPLKLAAIQILCLSPFVAIFALSTIFYDKTPTAAAFGPLQIHTTQGILRCVVILLKFAITMTTLIALAATTRFPDMLKAMSSLKVPDLLVMQIGMLHRYIFIIVDRSCNMLRARNARKFKRMPIKYELKTAAGMLTNLASYSTDTACRVGMAMSARGFNGNIETLHKARFKKTDAIFTAGLAIYIGILFAIKGAI